MKLVLAISLAAFALDAAEIGMAREGGKFVLRVAETVGELAVSVDRDDAPPMLGIVTSEGGATIFTPRFPLLPGVRYRATDVDSLECSGNH